MPSKTGRVKTLEAIASMPKSNPVVLEDDEITIKMAVELLSKNGETWSASKAKNRLDRLVDAGKMKRSKVSNTIIYKWVA